MSKKITETGPVGLKGINREKNKDIFDSLTDFYMSGNTLTPESTATLWASPAVENVGMKALEAGYGESRFDKYATYYDLDSLNDLRAAKQTAFGQIMNGTGKMGVLTGTTFLDNTLGTVIGLLNIGAEAIQGNIHSGSDVLNAFIDNPVSSFLQNVNNKSEEWMPNYETEYQQNLPWWKKIATANFIGDHFLKNLGFFAGAYFSGMASAKLLTSATAINKTKQLFKGVVNTKGEALKTASDVVKAYKTGDAIMDGQKIASNVASAARKVRNQEYLIKIASGISGSVGESRMEALSGSEEDYNYRFELLQQQKQQELNSIDSYIFENYPELFEYSLPVEGNTPIPRALKKEGIQLKKELIKGIEEKYKAHETELANNRIQFANNAFLWNLAITSLDNIYQFGEAFTGGITKARGIAAVRNLAKGVYKGEKKGIIGNTIDMLSSPISEGTQEMLQRSTQIAEERWSAKKFNEYYGSALDPKALDAKKKYLANFFNATSDVYTDPEEWENFVLGAVTSLVPLPGGGSRFWTAPKANKEAGEYNQSVAEAMNKIASDPNKREWIFHLSRLDSATSKQEEAVAFNDAFSFKNAEMDKAVSSVITYTQGDKFQDLLDIIEEAYDVTEEDVDTIKALSIDKETGKSVFEGMTNKQIVKHFKAGKETALKNAKKIHDIYSNMSVLFTGKSQEFINSATYLAATIDDRENRIKQITSNVINAINTNINNFREVYGYDPVEALQDIHDLNTYFSEEDKALLQHTTASKKGKKILETLSKKQKAKAKRKQMSGKILGYSNPIKRLEAKKASEGLTEKEEKLLQKYKEKQQKAKTSMDKAIQVIEDLKEFKYTKEDVSKTQVANVRDQLQDLVHLLNEREIFADELNELQKNPEIFEESLAKDVANFYNTFIKAKKEQNYKALKRFTTNRKEAIKTAYEEGKFTPSSLEALATEKNDEEMLKDIKEINKLMSLSRRVFNIIKDTNNRIYDGTNGDIINIKNNIGNSLQKIVNDAATEKEASVAIENYLTKVASNPNPIIAKIASNIQKEFNKSKENTTSASSKKTSSTNTTSTKKNKSNKENPLIKYKKNPKLLDDLSEEELKNLIINSDLFDLFGLTDPSELDSFDKEGMVENIKIDLEDYEISEENDDKVEEEESTEETEEEENEEGEETSEDGVVSISNKEKIITAPARKVIERKSASDAVFDSSIPIVDTKKGTEELYVEGEIETGYSWTIGQHSSEYEIDPLKDPKERKLVKRDRWFNGVFERLKVGEFVNSGELSKIWLLADSLGEQLPVTFVQLRNQGHKEEAAKINTYGAEDLFLAVDWAVVEEMNKRAPEEYRYKIPENSEYFKYDFYKDSSNTSSGKSKMQVIGKFDLVYNSKGEVSKSYKTLVEKVKEKTDNIKYVDNEGSLKQSKFVASNITTTLDWVFSGRLVKQNDTFNTVKQRDLLDVVPKKDGKLIDLNGEIQLAIITPNGEVVLGDDLEGIVIEPNQNRPKSSVTTNSRRLATPWIKIREADGRVYYKAVRIKKFDSFYTDDSSAIATKIKSVLKNIIKTKNEELIKNNLSLLRQYLYVPDDNKIFVNLKTNEIKIGENSISLESSVEDVYNFVKQQGYAFTFGLDSNMSLMDVINSNILTTDLAQLHNANASMIVGRMEFNNDGTYVVYPHDNLTNKLHNEIHLGKKGFQSGRGFSAPIKIQGDENTYIKSDNGNYYIEIDGHREEVIDLSDTTKIIIDFMIELPSRTKTRDADKIPWFGGKKGTKSATYIYPYKVGNTTYYISDRGHLLSEEELQQFNIAKRKNVDAKKRDKAKAFLEKALKGKSEEKVTLTKEDIMNKKKEIIKEYLSNNNLTEISEKDIRDVLKINRKQVKEFMDSIVEEDGLYVENEIIKVLKTKDESASTLPSTTTMPEVPKNPVQNTKFTSRKKAARKQTRESTKPENNFSVLTSAEIEEMVSVLSRVASKIPTELQNLRREVLSLLPESKSIIGLQTWLANTLADTKINTKNIEDLYNKASSEDFENIDTLKDLFTEIKQTLEC